MLKTTIGFVFLQLSSIGLVTNVLVLGVLIRLFQRPDAESTYLIAILVVSNDTLSLLLNICYFAPTMILNNYLISQHAFTLLPMILSNITFYTVYMSCFIVLLMGVNRLVTVVYHKSHWFTTTSILAYFFFASMLAIGKLIANNFAPLCCPFSFDHKRYGFTFSNPENVTNIISLAGLGFQGVCFVLTGLCYLAVFKKLHYSPNIESSQNSAFHKLRRARERSFVIQFATVSLFFILYMTISVAVRFAFLRSYPPLNMTGPLLYTVDCSANGLVYVFLNKEVKDYLKKMYCRQNAVHAAIGTTVTTSRAKCFDIFFDPSSPEHCSNRLLLLFKEKDGRCTPEIITAL